ncbi:MAG: radical SAM protein, partial [Candidatus Riflebacteria bacterium]|nr:radical SAM protein [Candidatus Riflebacteria bacterium]
MQNIVLTAINSRHTHSALGLAYIKSFWEKEPGREPLQIEEFDLNQTNENIIADLIRLSPEILAFSVYIWSLSRILVIAGAMKAAFPEIKIIMGGPEVSFNANDVMKACPDFDFIVRGEGEVTFSELLQALLSSKEVEAIQGLTWRREREILDNPDRDFLRDLDDVPSPFRSGAYKGVHSFTYYEGSRGCPSRCSYCLSSVLGPVRHHSSARIKADLDWFFSSDYRQIRFADRTFNHDQARAREIITYILENNKKNINFHFEIQADFLADDIIDLLAQAPEGIFHLEIGIQSTNPATLQAVNRRYNLEVLREKIRQLKKRTRCHLHVDLLGALPGDTLQDFNKSLDEAWQLDPDDIQICLVKVLRGTPLQKLLLTGQVAAMPS